MAKYTKEPLRVYDEPITIDKFTGGINNTPANESMHDNELRDAVNWHYNETVLERRLGAKIIADLVKLENIEDVNYARRQGTFIYGIGVNTYVIHICDGRIFYANIPTDLLDAQVEDSDAELEVFESVISVASGDLSTKLKNYNGGGTYNITGNPLNEYEGLILYCNEDTLPDTHDGYLYTDKTDSNATILRIQNTKKVEGIGIKDRYEVNRETITDDTFRLASGTRYIKIFETSEVVDEETIYTLTSQVVQPLTPTGWNYAKIGMNKLSPYPIQLIVNKYDAVETFMSAIKCGNLKKYIGETNLSFEAVMDFPSGKTAQDYYFRWEAMKLNSIGAPQTGWVTLNNGVRASFENAGSKGKSILSGANTTVTSLLSPSAGDKINVRCTFCERFETIDTLDEQATAVTTHITETLDCNTATNGSYTAGTYSDFKVDVLKDYGSTYVQLEIVGTSGAAAPTAANSTFLSIHSCRKIISDGNNLILYDDYLGSGNWYKSVVEKFNYFTDKGSLNFQTDKNEALIKAINFEGNIVCFAYNKEIGGNISVVLGSGDDIDSGDGYYAPYRRKIANTSITTDHPNTVQVIENSLIFKFRDTVYIIDSKQLDADRVDVVAVNDKLKHYTWLKQIQITATEQHTFDTVGMVQMPNIHDEKLFLSTPYENRVYSEVTEDYYALIYPDQKLRWKMYFKLPVRYEGDPKTYYPWLRDISETAFDVTDVCYLKGVSTLVTNSGKLVQFTSLDYKDLSNTIYNSKLITKAYDLGYPKFIKFLQNLNVYYYRDYNVPFTLNVDIKNEADMDIYGLVYNAYLEHDEDLAENSYTYRDTLVDKIIYRGLEPIEQRMLIADYTTLEGSILGPQPRYISKVFTPINMRPFLSISVTLDIADATNVTIGSLGFNFVSAKQPDESLQNYYGKIINF